MEAAEWWIKTLELDHIEKAVKIRAMLVAGEQSKAVLSPKGHFCSLLGVFASLAKCSCYVLMK